MSGFFSTDGMFYKIGTLIADVVLLGVAWLIFSIPVVTIGASTTALYYVATRRISDREGYIFRDFWSSFKSNFKKSTIVWVVALVIIYVLYINITYLRGDLLAVGGTGVPGATVEITYPSSDGNGIVDTVTVGDDGNWADSVPDGVVITSTLSITLVQTEPGKLPSDQAQAALATQADQTPSTAEVSAAVSVNREVRSDRPLRTFFLPFQYVIIIEFLFISFYIYAIIARFEMPLKDVLKTAFFMGNRHLVISIATTLVAAVVVLLVYMFPPAIIFAMGLFAFLHSFLLLRVFRKYRPEIDRDPGFEQEKKDRKKKPLFANAGNNRKRW
ncbi:MAG: DUF624 domain-containing protein [Defluviitaleaceae bacterium]|nr:DUF624 domain-containing protein [Defluviitaleaceae bacterium]